MKSYKGYLKQIHPVLPVKNVKLAIEYYVKRLGFQLAFRDNGDSPNYAGVLRDGIEIHLQWHHEDEWEAGIDRPMLRIYVENIEALFEEYKVKDIFHKQTSLKQTPWETEEFAFYDLDFSGLTFYRNL